MSLAEHLQHVQPRPKGKVCETCLWYDKLSDRDKEWFDRWVAEEWSTGQLWQAARDGTNYQLSQPALKYHIKTHHGRVSGGAG